MIHSQSFNPLSLQCLSNSNALAVGCWRADGQLWDLNTAWLELTGYSPDEFDSGQARWTNITPPEFAPLDAQALCEIRDSGSCAPYEKEYVRKDGRRVPILLRAVAFGAGVCDAGVFFAVNLTERKNKFHLASADSPKLLVLTERQRVICLLLSLGESEKRIAGLLDLGLRTIEYDKHLAAQNLGLPISRVVIWAVENRRALLSATRSCREGSSSITAAIDQAMDELDRKVE